ncbi:hypothetical protein KFL_002100070 [Klebsormidium nitens]|uniref:MYND-type domain-containing protein n=1 Tax=Klebsormidium nitens TaxID=105231 RepID=A0A1Y1I848_KLENI|nr:hypothetical protein KFL_002100070 [Klebsormidium nitens]|eukprot:GAQ84877.1 hypothetical protein KFL_002100070 [Klebsormidium nitens]
MRTCAGCKATEYAKERDFQRCGRCKVPFYCSKECQRADWQVHRKICKELKQRKEAGEVKKCGLCGNRERPLTKTKCCNHWICDDAREYQLFSYDKNCCYRNHKRYTLCASHHDEGHGGDWRTCQTCKDYFQDPWEWWWRGRNFDDFRSQYNFEVLPDTIPKPPMPRCSDCNRGIDTRLEAHSLGRTGILCTGCVDHGSTPPLTYRMDGH